MDSVSHNGTNKITASILSHFKWKFEYLFFCEWLFLSWNNMLHSITEVKIKFRVEQIWWFSEYTLEDNSWRKFWHNELVFVCYFDWNISIKSVWGDRNSFDFLLFIWLLVTFVLLFLCFGLRFINNLIIFLKFWLFIFKNKSIKQTLLSLNWILSPLLV